MMAINSTFRLLALLLLLAAGSAWAQVCAVPGKDGAASVAGVLNSFYPGTAASVSVGATTVTVGLIDTSSGGAATPVAAGDLLVLMQMQGALIDSSNSDCYGDGVGTAGCTSRIGISSSASYAGGNLASGLQAGNWEYCLARTAVASGSIGLLCAGTGGGTVNAYSNLAFSASSGAYRYQVVRVPQYSSATLTGNLTTAAWNGATGGVLAVQSAGALTMAGFAVDASQSGFRGGGVTFFAPYGASYLDPVDGTSFYTAVAGTMTASASGGGEREGSFKAEGIAGTPRAVYTGSAQIDTLVEGYPNGSRARGAPGNAGGGGNNQNCGGGGGGNGGLGGSGGGCWDDASRPTTFRDGGGLGGDGASRAGNNLNLSINRLILGGGGGAAHVDGGGTNCEQGGWGGRGGGIVLVRAGSIATPGSINANGRAGFGPNTGGACTDAAGGGGAGGTVVVAVAGGGLGGLAINARGGNGGVSSYDQHGPGGGGGGGVVYYAATGAVPTVAVSGGSHGTDTLVAGRPGTPGNWFSTDGTGSSLAGPSSGITTTCATLLAVAKTDGTTTVAAGSTTSYTVTFSNSGFSAADGAIAKDTPSAGLSCSVSACTASSGPPAAQCPLPAVWGNLLTAGGVAVPVLPPLGSVQFAVVCGVTATGL